ncbi:zinc-binding dehydrogenase [Pyxidicoccus xibeiensis]|uniref:zinc-binding dehydrogenase n=1 Tax=Pyxidicoccus xibeiensis TaxID=2906759 RepID=UPI0020A82E7A|nr:zinc-binding dehydrogenase [Pyxidicoccus xibeiensis]MCP3138631.1 zinc-binding dehydrogenase [Pyxidicoccus xibeiensis]
MRVAQVTRFGGPEVLVTGEAPEPVAGPGQVVVDVAAASVLFVETQVRSGWGRQWFPVQPPYVPGNGVAGHVRSVGAGVDPGWVGRRVVTRTLENGGYAERALASVEELIPVPDGLGLREAAALIHDGTTVMGLAESQRLRAGEWVLITAAGGGLGLMLVQVARAAGARVIGAARGKAKLGLVREQGAEVVVDYSEPGWVERVREVTGGKGPDLVLDGAGGEVGRAAFEVTARGGRFSAHGAPSGGFTRTSPEEAERRGVTVRGIEQVRFGPAEAKRMAERAIAEAAAGRLRPIIGQSFPLEQAAAAHAALEGRHTVGKTLLEP